MAYSLYFRQQVLPEKEEHELTFEQISVHLNIRIRI